MAALGLRSDDPIDALIRQHRTADATVTVFGADGEPLARQEVVVGQRSHAFSFGCTGAELIALANDEVPDADRAAAEQRAGHWLGLFDFATLPFYWAGFEPVRGRPDTERLLTAAQWLVDRGCVVKGHPLCWHTETAPWLLELSTADAIAAQLARIEREVTAFDGVIDTWDVVNEAVIMPVFDRYENGVTRMCQALGQVGIVKATFEAARAANPGATLLLNDFDVSPDYERLIGDCLDAGIGIDVLGIQSHMHQGYWGEAKTLEVLERFARFGLPIHFTENTLVSGRIMPPEIVDLNDYQVSDWPSTPDGEQRQADEVTRHYRTLVSHPAVDAITWWGIDDGGWLNAPTGLVRTDGSTKPAYEALAALIKGDWWLAPASMVTDEAGNIAVSGFLGEYEVMWAGRTAEFRIAETGTTTAEARVVA
jgi:GH35 family endo-1,4-beta-xylanase